LPESRSQGISEDLQANIRPSQSARNVGRPRDLNLQLDCEEPLLKMDSLLIVSYGKEIFQEIPYCAVVVGFVDNLAVVQ